MTNLSAARDTEFKITPFDMIHEKTVKTAATIWQGSGVAIGSDGYLVHSSQASALFTIGVAEATVESAAAGDKLRVRSGCAKFANDAGHLLGIANVLGPCYWTDDNTVGTDSSKLLAGIVYQIDSDGVWVIMGPIAPASPSVAGALLAANNLNDVADAAASAENLGLGVTDSPTMAGPTFTGALKAKESVFTPTAGGYTVLNANGDQTVVCSTDNDVVTLPDAAAANKGMKVTVVCAAADGAAKIGIAPHSSDNIYGTVANAAADCVASGVNNKAFELTKATQNKGDYAIVQSDGSGAWRILGGVGIWLSAS